MQIVRPIVDAVGELGSAVRNLARMREVAAILVKHGLGGLVRGIPGVDAPATATRATPSRVAAALEELGPTFVKLGQVLSTRPDLLPADYILALQQLQDGVTAVPLGDIEAVLSEDLGSDWRDRLRNFDDQPLATASIAQVHTARLADGSDVVLKIQRPGIAAQIESDLHILRFLARRAMEEYPESRAMDPEGLLREFERTMRGELDFRREADHMRRFRVCLGDQPHVVIPDTIDDLVTRRVLCMQRLYGVPMRKARESGFDMTLVGERYLGVVFDMILVHGFFHGDLHPGNVLVLPGGALGLLDFGMVGTLTVRMRNQLVTMMFALQRGDHRTIARILHDIAIKDDRLDFRRLETATTEVVEQHFPPGAQLKDIEMSTFSVELVTRAASLGARVPTSYMMVLKALVTAEGLAKSLIQEVDPIASAEPYFRMVAADRLAPDKLQQEGLYALLTLSSLADRLPITLSQLLDDLDEQRLSLSIRHIAHPDDRALSERIANRYAMVTLASAALIGGALVPESSARLALWVLSAMAVLLATFLAWRSGRR